MSIVSLLASAGVALALMSQIPSALAGESGVIFDHKDWYLAIHNDSILIGKTRGSINPFNQFALTVSGENCTQRLITSVVWVGNYSDDVQVGQSVVASLTTGDHRTEINFTVSQIEPVGEDFAMYGMFTSHFDNKTILELLANDFAYIDLAKPAKLKSQIGITREMFSLAGSKATFLKMIDTCATMMKFNALEIQNFHKGRG